MEIIISWKISISWKFPYPVKASKCKYAYLFKINNNYKQKLSGLNDYLSVISYFLNLSHILIYTYFFSLYFISPVPCRTGSRTGTWDQTSTWGNTFRARIILRTQLCKTFCHLPDPPPSFAHLSCALLGHGPEKIYQEAHTFMAQWKTEEKYRLKK